MSKTCCGASLYTSQAQFIKFTGDIIAVNGSSTTEKLTLTDLRFTYKQIIKTGTILKKGEETHILNVTDAKFIAIKATFDTKSVIEEDNYLLWGFTNDMNKTNTMGELLILTGNSTHLVPNIFITNPNSKYTVTLEILAGIGDVSDDDDDDASTTTKDSQAGYSYINLKYTDIKTVVIGTSFKIIDNQENTLTTIVISDIKSNILNDDIIILNDNTHGTMFLQFINNDNAKTAKLLIDYLIANPNSDISKLDIENLFK